MDSRATEIRYESAQHGATALSSVRSGRRGVGRGIGYENWVPRSGSDRVGSGLKRVQEIQCRFRENTPPSDPDRDLGGQPTPTPRRPDPPAEAKVECHPRTLESQTLKMREPVRRRFVTDLPGFRRLLIRQGGFVTYGNIALSGNKNSYRIV